MASIISRLSKAATSILSGPSINEPRKGTKSPIVSNSSSNFVSGGKMEPRAIMATQNLRMVAGQDDVIVALRRVLRNAIGEMQWKIVPDVSEIEADLKRWKSTVELNLQMPGLRMHFVPQAMSADFFARATGSLADLLNSEAQAGVDLATSQRLHQFFENVLGIHNTIAESHVSKVHKLFTKPNATDTWRNFISQVIDSLTLYDAAAIVKNPKLHEDEIGEIYTIPGEDVRIYRRADRNTPQPPFIAYDWSTNDRILAFYNAYELSYLCANPQPDGYGIAPLECLVRAMLSTISSDQYLLDFFENNNIPPGVFDLGPNVDQGERDAVERKWNNEIRKGLRRVMFVSMQDGVKGWLPIPQSSMRENEIIAIHEMWVKRKCAVFGLSPNDIGNTQDMHLANADNQAELTQSRGIESFAKIIENYINADIVKGQMWRRNNPLDINDPTGYPLPVFPFNDVKFEFVTKHDEMESDKSDKEHTYWSMGVLSINEIRKEKGMSAIPGGDEHVMTEQVFMKVEDLPNLPAPTQADTVTREPDGRERDQHNQPEMPTNGGRPQVAFPSQNRSEPPSAPQTQSLKSLAANLADMLEQKRK